MAHSNTVLVLEDNDFVRMQIVKFLRDGGYDVVEATAADQGFQVIQDRDVHCALVDVRMEPEDGFSFIQRAQANDLFVPTILVTGDQNHDILSRASSMGVSSVLMKPVNKDRLLKMVERTIATAEKSG